MNVTFYNFSKRRNSTKRPSGGTSYSCLLKDDTSTARPSIAIKWNGTSSAPAGFNYCYIPDFGRYYWVNSWTYSERQWIAACSVDVLATYKTEIGSSSKYVLRAASDYDPEVIDTLYTPKLTVSVPTASVPGSGFNWATDLSGGTIILGIIGMRSTVAYSAGGVSYYACTPANYIKLLSDLYTESLDIVDNENYGSNVGDAFKAFSRNILKSVTNPTQYIKSAMWFPFSFSTGSAINPIIAGITSTAVLYPLDDPVKREWVSFPAGFNYNSATDYWKNVEPFVKTVAVLPPYGVFTIPRKNVIKTNTTAIRLLIDTDAISGQSSMIITMVYSGSTGTYTIAQSTCQVGVPMDISGVKNSGTSFGALAGAAASVLSGDVIGSAAGVANMIEQSMPGADSRSSFGGIAGDIAPKYIQTVYSPPVDEDPDEKGRPLCKVKTISTLSGYVLCADGEVDCNATAAEHSELESFLTGGFFYE